MTPHDHDRARFAAARERAKQQARLADAFRAIRDAMSGPDDVRMDLERGRGGEG